MEHNNLHSNTQSNRTYNTAFTSNFAHNARQQEEQSQARPVPPLGNAPDLYAHPLARNLQDYNTIRPIELDPWDLSEYQPIKPGEPYMEKLADEVMNTKKVELFLKHAQEYKELGDFKDAEKAYKKALRYTENAEHYKLYATCLRQVYLTLSQALTKDEARERIYREKAARAFYYLGELYEKQGAWNPAQTAYKASGELACYEASLQALVAVARQLEDTAEISNALEKLADFYAEKGAIALAIEKLKEAFELGESFAILDKLEALYGKTGGEDSQLKVNETRIHQFELQISQNSKNISLYRQYVWFLKDIGQRNAARAVKERMDTQLQAVQRELFQDLQQNFQTLEQKLVKQKTKIGGLKQTIQSQDGKLESLGKQVEFLGRQVIHLDFSMQTDIIDAILYMLPERFENLQELNLRGCKQITEAGLEWIAENTSKLQRLTLDYCPGTTIKLLHKLNAKGIAFTIEGVSLSSKPCLDLSIHKDTLTDTDLLKALQENPEITQLNLSGCSKITDTGLAPLKNFQWLTSLNLQGCSQLTDAGLKHLAGLTQLKSLLLHYCNKLSDGGVQHLRGLTQLATLGLAYTQLTDEGLQYLSGLTQLTYLNVLDCNKITDAGLKHLAGLTQLKILDLESCHRLTDIGLQHLRGLTQLTTLNLTYCWQVTDLGLEYLAGFTQLTLLKLHGCSQLTDAGLRHLVGLTQLTSLVLYNCKKLSDGGLQHLRGLTQLTTLGLSNSIQFTDASLQHLADFTQLKVLYLGYCNQLTDTGLQHLSGLTQLTDLAFSDCPQLTDASLQYLKGLTQLKFLALGHSNQFTDEGLQQLKGFTQLTQLSLYGCTQLTDTHLQRLAGFTQLTSLNLYNCNQITDEGLQYLKGLIQLKTLDLRACPKITVEAKEELKRQIPELNIIG